MSENITDEPVLVTTTKEEQEEHDPPIQSPVTSTEQVTIPKGNVAATDELDSRVERSTEVTTKSDVVDTDKEAGAMSVTSSQDDSAAEDETVRTLKSPTQLPTTSTEQPTTSKCNKSAMDEPDSVTSNEEIFVISAQNNAAAKAVKVIVPKSTDDAPKIDTEVTSTTSKATTEAPVHAEASSSSDAYKKHMTYEADGTVIYTDPKTKHRQKWCTTANKWLPFSDTSESVDNPYENEHYKWCLETHQWVLKETASHTHETEHYKWDAEKHEWVLKPQATSALKTTPAPTNVTYSINEEGERIYTDKDGAVFFWDASKNAWFPKIDEDFMARYQMNYGFIDNTSAAEEEKRKRDEEADKLKELQLQRMTEEAKAATAAVAADGAASDAGLKRKAQEPPKWFDMDPSQNTKVYVWNLPLDITIDEFAEVMGKCGMIMRDPQTQKFKLKLYAEPDGQLKGDGLCDYIKVESVDLALKILDEYNLRGHKIRVQRAQFQMRGEYNPALKPKRKKKDKEKLQKMKERLFDWRPEKMRGERSKNEKVVILKNLFEPSIFEKEVQLILEYQNDLREECSKCGNLRKVIIFDRHPEGVAQINMSTPEEADQVIQMMQGRFFGKRQLTAEHWDGKTKYKVAESENEVQERLTNWDKFLETEEEKKLADEQNQKGTEDAAVAKEQPTIEEDDI